MAESAARIRLALLGRSAFSREARAAERSLSGIERQGRGVSRSFKGMGATAGKAGLGVIGAAAGGAAVGLGYAVKAAASFEKQNSSLGAVAQASAAQMKTLKAQSLAAGAATAYSAKEAAVAQTELAKGGLSVKSILGGGLTSALSLAAAGELELGEAAAITANSMNLFGLSGRESGKVADSLATAANATTADVSDFGMALTQGGAVAKSAGLSFTDTVVALEALAASGVKNSDAGTSLKTSLIQLIKPTKVQAGLAKKLGLSFVGVNGKFKDMGDVSEMLRERLGGMGKAQRTATLATLAGTDGVRTLTALYDAGPAKLAGYEKGLKRQGSAAEVAKKKQDNLAGTMERLSGSFETASILVGDAMLPTLKSVADQADKTTSKILGITQRKDLSGEQKVKLSLKAARADFTPMVRDLKKTIGDMDLGDKLGDAVEAAAPRMADAMAAAVPRMAGAFGNAFVNAGPGGQLLTAAVIAKKMGAFSTVGRLMAGRTAASTAAQLPTSFAARKGKFTAAGRGLGSIVGGGQAGAGTKLAASTAVTSATQLGPSMQHRKGKLTAVGSGLGNILGRAAGGVAVGLIVRDIAKSIPALDQYSGKKGWEELGRDLKDGIRIWDAPKARPGPPTRFSDTLPARGAGTVARPRTDRDTDRESVRGRATGGTVAPGEVTLVGERGPELARFPPRTQISTASQTRRVRQRAAGTVVNVYPRIIVQQDRRGTWRAVLDVERDMAERE